MFKTIWSSWLVNRMIIQHYHHKRIQSIIKDYYSSSFRACHGFPATKIKQTRSFIEQKKIKCIKYHLRNVSTNSFDWQAAGGSKKNNQKQKDQFIHDHLNASQDPGTAGDQNGESFWAEQDIVKEPPRERFGVIKAVLIIAAGIYFGAYVAMIGAKLLEDLDIFVQERDGDDD